MLSLDEPLTETIMTFSINTMNDLGKIDVSQLASAIETDMAQRQPELHASLQEAKTIAAQFALKAQQHCNPNDNQNPEKSQ